MSTLVVDTIKSKSTPSRSSDAAQLSRLSGRNRIINGNFPINERGVSGSVSLSSGEYGHDRWVAGASGCDYTFATANGVTTLTISAGSLIQVILGDNLFTDTYVLSWNGTAQGKIGAGSYSDSGVTGSVTGGSNLNIEFGTGTLSKVQFEIGDVATPFEHLLYNQDLENCQFYGQKIGAGATGQWLSSTETEVFQRFHRPMRTTPTMSVIDSSISVIEAGVNIRTTTNAPTFTVNPAAYSANMGGFTGATAGNFAAIRNADEFFADAELTP